MRRASDIAVRIFAALGLIVFCLVVVLVAIMMWKAPIHQLNLWRLGRNFQAVAPFHPPGSELLLRRKDFGGLFSGASNSCDYFVGEFRSAPRSKEEITRTYAGISIDSFDRTERIPVEVHFFDEEEFFIRYPWYEWRAELRGSSDRAVAQDNVYVVFASQTGYPAYGDIRCH